MQQSGVYALILDQSGRILTVTTASGRHYLPGGRIEADETAEQALLREISEECGWEATLLSLLAVYRQPIMEGTVDLHSSYWTARLRRPLASQPEHGIAWLPVGSAPLRLHRESDRQAVLTLERNMAPHST